MRGGAFADEWRDVAGDGGARVIDERARPWPRHSLRAFAVLPQY
jgi:hypothetical protein